MTQTRLTIVCALMALASSLAGCGFQPLHGSTVGGELMQHQLSSVHVPLINGRVGQQVRNELLYQMTGGDHLEGKQYVLNVAVRKSVMGIALARTGDAASKIYRLDATFTLSKVTDKKDGQAVFKSKSSARAAFDQIFVTKDVNGKSVKLSSTYANMRAERDAANRAAKSVANDIKIRIAAFISANS